MIPHLYESQIAPSQYHTLLVRAWTAVAQRQQLVTEMRDSIEIVHTSEYGNFLKHLFPAFHKLLSEGRPQFSEGPEQKIRNMLLEVLNRLPNNETLRPHVPSMLSLCMKLLETDNGAAHRHSCASSAGMALPCPAHYICTLKIPCSQPSHPFVKLPLTCSPSEENAVICLRIIFDLHKNFRPHLEREVEPFLQFVQRIVRSCTAALPAAPQLMCSPTTTHCAIRLHCWCSTRDCRRRWP